MFLAKVQAKVANKPFFGTVENTNWAVCIDGLDNEFPKLSFGQQLSDLKKYKEFVKSAKSTHVGTKGIPTLPAVKKFVKEHGFKQFAARWLKDSAMNKDDSVELFYKE